ncbi:MAG: hypothetical protein NTX53_14035 [candidate division WOR-3 bacterium]|nr:hypothetical protein [candidate division WOR-3 bacterium]
MREIVRFPADACLPSAADVLAAQGVPADRETPEPIAEALREALKLFLELAAPIGIVSEIPTAEFAEVYGGEGRNAQDSPLAGIFPKAGQLLLFAVTIGDRVGDEISRLFAAGRFDLGYLLDAVASSGTDRLAQKLQECCGGTGDSPHAGTVPDTKTGPDENALRDIDVPVRTSPFPLSPSHLGDLGVLGGSIPVSECAGRTPAGTVFLRYSPGYCGWDITGQRQLFQALRPEEIGITLRESCLMEPLKSISGVLVAARPEVHRFDNTYPFCSACTTQTCRSRIAAVEESRGTETEFYHQDTKTRR